MKRSGLSLVLLLLSMISCAQVMHPVISQVYGGGGNTGAVYNRDYVELFNPTATAVALSGFSLQYAPATGGTWSKVDLAGTIGAYGYFLVQLAGGTAGAALPLPDQTASINIAAGSGKLALVQQTTALAGNCPAAASIIDLVGYGTADCREGSNASSPSALLALFRVNGGCRDSNDNSMDFITAPAAPRNSSAAPNNCAMAGGALPVVFSHVGAYREAAGFRIEWTNETEENLWYYEVEYANAGMLYHMLDKFDPQRNDHSAVRYQIHRELPATAELIRVKAVEWNGKVTYSPVVRINAAGWAHSDKVYPNPAREGYITVQLNDLARGKYDFRLCNIYGQLVFTKKIDHEGGPLRHTINFGKLPSGIYAVQLRGIPRQIIFMVNNEY